MGTAMQRIVSIACLLLLFSSYLHATPTQNKPITLSDLETIYIQEWKQDPITNQLHEHFNTVALTQNTNNASTSYQMPETITQTTVVHAALITLQSRNYPSPSNNEMINANFTDRHERLLMYALDGICIASKMAQTPPSVNDIYQLNPK